MNSRTGASVKYRTPLRQAQRELTRGRIRDAARELFYEHHYDTTTMDEIALAAGLRRSTVYLHFRDKAEILADIIADYTPRARALLATLPGPAPTLRQVQRWMTEVVKFVAKERVPLSIIQELRRMNRANAQALRTLTSELLSGLGANNPPFALAARDNATPAQRARPDAAAGADLRLRDVSRRRGRRGLLESPADRRRRGLPQLPEPGRGVRESGKGLLPRIEAEVIPSPGSAWAVPGTAKSAQPSPDGRGAKSGAA